MTEAGALPGVLAEIEALAGREVALALALALGGRSIHMPRPKNIVAGHALLEACGASAASIAEHYAGECLYIPKARRALVGHLSARGSTTQEIARLLGITGHTVRQYRRGR